jgi:hypothetical protein
VKNLLAITLVATLSYFTTSSAHALYQCVDVKNDIIRENRKLDAQVHQRERLAARYEARAWTLWSRNESASATYNAAVDHLRAAEEQVVKMGYGCVLDPIPCTGSGTQRLRSEIERARAQVVRERGLHEKAFEMYTYYVADQTPRLRALDAKIASTQSYINQLTFSLEICSQQQL